MLRNLKDSFCCAQNYKRQRWSQHSWILRFAQDDKINLELRIKNYELGMLRLFGLGFDFRFPPGACGNDKIRSTREWQKRRGMTKKGGWQKIRD